MFGYFFKALWIHRRFLSQCWIKHFTANEGAVILDPDDNLISSKIEKFLAKELQLVKSCLNISPDEFDDTQDQARYGASYLLWILKVHASRLFSFPDLLLHWETLCWIIILMFDFVICPLPFFTVLPASTVQAWRDHQGSQRSETHSAEDLLRKKYMLGKSTKLTAYHRKTV